MSLLMDALKRAEQAKRQQAAESGGSLATSGAENRLQLEPVESVEAAAVPSLAEARVSPLPDLKSHLDSVEADLKATAAEHPTRRAGSAQRIDSGIDRAVAQNVLAAGAGSSGAAGSIASDGDGKQRLIAIISIGVLAAAGIGGYFYWQLQGLSQTGSSLTGPGLRAAPPRPPPAPQAIQTTPPLATSVSPINIAAPANPAPATTANAPANVSTNMSTPPPAGSAASVPPGTPTNANRVDSPAIPAIVARPSRLSASPTTTATAKPRSGQPGSAAKNTGPSAGNAAEPLRVSSQSQDSPVLRGYEALQAGRFADAKSAYSQALRADSRDPDALLGLAALAQREGQSGSAADYYERVLQNDPRNAAAHAGMSALQGGTDPSQAESRLKSLINLQNSDPNATAPLNFALGNLYAGQRRWAEAQQAYFKAHTADAGNPDTLYNLAISLEHLNQPGLAKQFYEQALQANRQRAASFDRAQAEKRLTALSR